MDGSKWDPGVILVGGGSGHAFKLAPVLGRMAAGYVTQHLSGKADIRVPPGGAPFLKWLRRAKRSCVPGSGGSM